MWTHHGPIDGNQVQGILKRVRAGPHEPHVTREGSSQLTSSKANEARRQEGDISQVLKERSCHTRILYQAELTFSKGEMKTSQDKQNISEFLAHRPSLQDILRESSRTKWTVRQIYPETRNANKSEYKKVNLKAVIKNKDSICNSFLLISDLNRLHSTTMQNLVDWLVMSRCNLYDNIGTKEGEEIELY